jgi:hypothetical protein
MANEMANDSKPSLAIVRSTHLGQSCPFRLASEASHPLHEAPGRLPKRSDVWQTAGMDTKETNCSNSQAARVRMLANLLLGALIGLAACWTIW